MLRDNYEQNVLLGNARAQEHPMLPVHQRLIHWLEDRGDLDRALEFLPTDTEIERRDADGLGLTSPEFSVLVAYAKIALKADLLAVRAAGRPVVPADPDRLLPEGAASSGTPTGSAEHPLRREIITNWVVNSMVNRGGITFAFRAHGGDRRDAGAGRAGVRGLPRGVRPAELRAPRSRRSTTWCRPTCRPSSTSSSAG